MRILLTGASSFTGFWFARELSTAGHAVTGIFRGESPGAYQDVRRRRVDALIPVVEPVWGVEFGDERFLDLVTSQRFDLIALHGAEMTNYRSWDFDPVEATRRNTRNLREVLARFAGNGGARVIATGSVFEPFEGVGDPLNRAFNPYGLSKHLTFEIVRLEAERIGLALGKFVIPNPFGPYEEFRFTSFLAREWGAGRTPSVATPAYVRDNIHVSLLALAYRVFCEAVPAEGVQHATPSGYVESQGEFALRVAAELGGRLGRSLDVALTQQNAFPEPLIKINAELAATALPQWSERDAWDAACAYWVEIMRAAA